MYFFCIILFSVTVFANEIFEQNKTKVFNGTGDKPHSAIIGGYEADFQEFPHAARLYIPSNKKVTTCTTEIIHPMMVITAAHCVWNESTSLVVVTGNNNQEDYAFGFDKAKYAKYTVAKKFIHPRFNPYSLKHDVAVLLLSTPMSHKGLKILPVSYDRMKDMEQGMIYGWGSPPPTKNHRLFSKELMVRPCKENLLDDYEYICLMEHGVELGDSGSPIIVEGKLRGICSHTSSEINSDGVEQVENYFFASMSEEKAFLQMILDKNGANYNRCFLFSTIMSFTFII